MVIEYNKNGEISLICSERMYKTLIELYLEDIEYNIDTSAEHLKKKDEDIVRATGIKEAVESQDKEPVR